jgi:VCBS repeat-containing protein
VPENQPTGTTVGTLSTTDADTSDTYTYALVSGTGDADNGSFTLSGNELKTAATFDFEAKSSYSIRVKSTDAGGLSTEKVFTITVSNVNEAPTLVVPDAQTAFEDVDLAIGGIIVGDPDGDTVTVTLSVGNGTLTLGNTDGLTASDNGTAEVILSGGIANLNAALASLLYRGGLNYSASDTLSITVSDGSLMTSGSVTITVKSVFQQAADLQAQVNALHAAGVLSTKQAKTLLATLDLKGNGGDAGKVQSFLNEVAGLLKNGTLTQEKADALLQPGNILLLGVTLQ